MKKLLLVCSFFSLQLLSSALEFSTDLTSSCQMPFKFDDSQSVYLKELASEYSLHDLVRTCNSELEQVTAVVSWVYNLWDHNGDTMPDKSDAISILREVTVDGKRFRCVEYAKVAAACLSALNITSRVLYLKTKDCQEREYGAGHAVCEVYLRSSKKWIMVDVQANIILADQTNVLNAVELQRAIACKENLRACTEIDFSLQEYLDWIEQYLYYFEVTTEPNYLGYINQKSIMLVPKDAVNPTIFEKKYPITNVEYTNCLPYFYPAV